MSLTLSMCRRMATKLISPKEAQILQLLVSGGEMYGLQLVRESKGELKRGTIYVTLDRMQKKGYLDSRHEHDAHTPGLPRRLYFLTAPGEKALELWEMVQLQGAVIT